MASQEGEKPAVFEMSDRQQPDRMVEDEKVETKDDVAVFAMYKRIFSYSQPFDWFLLGFGGLAAIGSGTAQALVQLVFGDFVQVISDFQRGISTRRAFDSAVTTFALRFIWIFIARFVLTYIFMACLTILGIRLSKALRYDYLRATLSQETSFFDGGEGGSVTMKVTTNGNQIQQGISEKLGLTIQAAATCVACVVVALAVQWKLTLVTLTITPVMIVVIGFVVAMVTKAEAEMDSIYGRGGHLAEDVISSIRNVHAFWMRPKLVARYDDYLTEAHLVGSKQSPYWGLLFCTEYFCIYSGFALAFFYGIQLFSRGEIGDPGVIVAVLFSVVIAATSLTAVSPFFQSFATAAAAASALFKTIDRKSKINPLETSGLKLEHIDGDISIEAVNFEYPTRPDIPVLQEYSLHCAPGKVTALVGASGCGKSTIVGLLERWYNPSSGSISIDGHPIESFDLNWLRTKIRLVQQEPVLLNGTVFDNVINGLTGTEWEQASREEQMSKVVEACKMSYAHDFVFELPEGYNTNVGERAGLLSGGQKQRIAIARALISNPKILLLDEATSALDPHSEGIVQQALDRAAKDRTTLVIAHKLATIRNADKIVVMQKGQILEEGTHESLLERGQAYASLVGAQDLSGDGKSSESDSEEDEKEKRVALQRTQTSDHPGYKELSPYQESLDFSKHTHSNLFMVIWYVLREQTGLRKIALPWTLACLVGGATFPAQALILSNLIDVFSLTGDELVDRGNFYALMFFIVAIANFACYFTLGYVSNIIAQLISHFYRRAIFDVVLQQDCEFFDRSENTTGSITSKLTSLPTSIFELFGFNLSIIFVVVVNLVSSSALALAVGWKLALILIFGGLPALVGAGYVKIRIEFKMAEDTSKRFSDSAALAGEAVAAIRTISSLAMERKTLDRFGSKIDGVLKSSMPFILHSTIWYAFSQSVDYCILALGFWYGCRLVASGEYSVPQFFIVFVGVYFSGQAAGQFFSYATSITKGVSAVNYIKWIRSLRPIVAEKPENQEQGPPEEPQPVAINDVGFVYPTRPADKVLKGITITAQPGAFIALVGGSGSGKSTIVSLLERFYDPTSGIITLGAANDSISTLNPRRYRAVLSLVQQEPTLYQGTIAENISLGTATDAPASDEDIWAACRKANIADFVSSLPEGLNTLVGTRGLSLSGGQRQRIAIARALIRDPRVLLLDEATSALDTESERVVQKALAEAASGDGVKGRITVAVAHRLSTIMGADRIYVMVRGRVVESGSHRDLIGRKGIYAEMCKAQSLDREV